MHYIFHLPSLKYFDPGPDSTDSGFGVTAILLKPIKAPTTAQADSQSQIFFFRRSLINLPRAACNPFRVERWSMKPIMVLAGAMLIEI